jgi:hypothetical protein
MGQTAAQPVSKKDNLALAATEAAVDQIVLLAGDVGRHVIALKHAHFNGDLLAMREANNALRHAACITNSMAESLEVGLAKVINPEMG